MKRSVFIAKVIDGDGITIGERKTYAWNSGVRATEAILREYGRENGFRLDGDVPEVYEDPIFGRTYRRQWSGNGSDFWALVNKER